MTSDERGCNAPGYEHPVHDLRWTTGLGRPAGVYWLQGRSLIAAHESPAEAWLVAQGAVLVATLRFDADPLETRHDGRALDPAMPAAVAAAFLVSSVN